MTAQDDANLALLISVMALVVSVITFVMAVR